MDQHNPNLDPNQLERSRRIPQIVNADEPTHPLASVADTSDGGILTALHLQQGFSEDAAGHADGLADVVSRIFRLDVGDGQLAAQRHREAARVLWVLLGGEQQDLTETNTAASQLASAGTCRESRSVRPNYSSGSLHPIIHPATNAGGSSAATSSAGDL